MRKVLPILARTSPKIAKKLLLPTFFSFYYINHQKILQKVHCSSTPFLLTQNLSDFEENIIKIELNGNLVGEAYCFESNYLVSVSYQLQEHHGHQPNKKYEFYLGEKKLSGNFRIIGHYQNLTFFEHTSHVTIKITQKPLSPLPFEEEKQPFKISPVQILMKREYPSVKNGYMVAQDSGYGIIDGKGQIGGVVIKEGKAAGIVTQIGKQLETGFIRMIQWKNLPKILRHLKQKKQCHFGISVQAQEYKEGIEVVRVAPNSPLRDELSMGDTILKVNNYRIRDVESLQRICIISDGNLTLEILRQNTPLEIKVQIE